MNIDADELLKFEEHAPRWWDKTGPLQSLHEINPLRLGFIREQVGSMEQLSVLDVGCGGGILTEALADLNATVTGIDANASLIAVAQQHALGKAWHLQYLATTVEAYAATHPAPFDVITCMELLEHVPDPASLVKTLGTLLKPAGKIFFSTINRTPAAFLKALVIGEHLLKLLPKGTHEYKKFIRPSELEQWCLATGISFNYMQGMSYHPVTKKYYLTHDIKVNYLVYAQRRSV